MKESDYYFKRGVLGANNTIEICQKDHIGVNSICPELNLFVKSSDRTTYWAGQISSGYFDIIDIG